LLRELSAKAQKKSEADPYVRDRLSDMLGFFELMTTWYEQTRAMPTQSVIRMCKLGDKVAKMLGIGS
jgi:hypothetical protein